MKKSHQPITEKSTGNELSWLEKLLARRVPIKTGLIVLLFFVLGILSYSNTFENPFVFDDKFRISENADIRLEELSIESFSKAITGKDSARSRPVGNVSFALNYYFHQYNLFGYHLVNTIIHVLNGILLYLFLKTTFTLKLVRFKVEQAEWIALLTAMLWLVNPVQTQSVTYIVQRFTSMAAMFFLLSFLFYLNGRLTSKKRKRWIWFTGAAVAWLLALGCKENTAILPFLILLYEWFFFQNLSKKWVRKHSIYFAAIVVLLAIIALIHLGTDPWDKIKNLRDFSDGQFSMGQRLLTQSRVVMHYISLTAVRLTIE